MKTQRSVLVICSPGFPKDEADTTCLTSQQNFVKAVNKKNPEIEIIILSFQYPFNAIPYDWFGNKVIPFNGRNRGNLFKSLLWRKVWRRLKFIHKEHEVIGILSFWCGECALLGNRFANKYQLKHFCWILGQDAKKDNSYVKRINPSEKELIAMSDFLADEFFASHSKRPYHVIPNGIDVNEFISADTDRGIDILGAGSLISLKQYDIFIEIVKELKKNIPLVKAVICGAGPEQDHLKSIIAEYKLEDNVLLTGELPHVGMLQLMQQCKILLHPSSYEGFSTVCLEALYAGCQVISFVKPMNTEIENWKIAKDKEDMLQKVLELLQTGSLKHKPVLPYSMDDSAVEIMKLFSCEV